MAQENHVLFGVNTFDYEDLCMKNPMIGFEDTWSYSNDEDNKERNESCFMALESPKVHLDPFSSNKTLDANELEKDNLELIRINNDWIKEIKALLREKRILQQETNKLSSRANELELEIKKIKAKEVVEPCLSCEKLTHVVDSLNNDVSKLQDEAMSFSKFKKSSINIENKVSCQDKEDLEKFESLEKPKIDTKVNENLPCPNSIPRIPQTHVSSPYGIQVPILSVNEMKQFYKPITHSRYDTFKTHKTHSKNKYHSQHSPQKKRGFNRKEKFYPNKRPLRPNNSKPSSQDTPWKIFSEFGLKILCNLLQDPRMYNMEVFYANLNGPIRKWGPRV